MLLGNVEHDLTMFALFYYGFSKGRQIGYTCMGGLPLVG